MREIGKIIAYAILAGIVMTILFVKSKTLGGQSGGEQASQIINSTTKGFAEIIRAASGG